MSTLFDDLAGAFGHPVDRPQLNAFVANAQANNALRSVQTEDAIQKAIAASALNKANAAIPGDIGGPNGQTIGDILTSGHGGTLDQVVQGLGRNTLANPTNLNTPADTAASAAVTGKLPVPYAVPANYALPVGMAAPTVMQTAQGAANLANTKAKTAQAATAAALSQQQTNLTPLEKEGIDTAAQRYAISGAQPSYGMMRTPAAMTEWYTQLGQLKGQLDSIGNLNGQPVSPEFAKMQPQDLLIAPEAQKGFQQFMTGAGGQAVRAFTTLSQSMPVLQNAIAALHNGQFTPQNAVVQTLERLTGRPAPTNMQLVPQYIAMEVMRGLRGGNFPEGEVKNLEQQWDVSRSSNPTGQLMNAWNETQKMIQASEAGLARQYAGATRGVGGRVPGIPAWEDLLAGHAAAAAPAAAAPTAAAPVYIKSPNGPRLMLQGNQWVPAPAGAP